MQALLKDAFVLEVGQYGEGVTRQNGAPISYVTVFDPSQPQDKTVTATIAEDIHPDNYPKQGDRIDLICTLAKRDGKWKLRADVMKAGAINGQLPAPAAQQAVKASQ